MAESNFVCLLQRGISVAVPAIAGLCGVVAGSLLTSRREKIGRRHKFLSEQLTDFYSPLLSLRKEIEAMGKVRVKIGDTAEKVWHEMCERYDDNPTELQKLTQQKGEKFDKIIDYDNEYLETETIPAYHKMIEIYRKNIHLAEPSTAKHYPALIEFVNHYCPVNFYRMCVSI